MRASRGRVRPVRRDRSQPAGSFQAGWSARMKAGLLFWVGRGLGKCSRRSRPSQSPSGRNGAQPSRAWRILARRTVPETRLWLMDWQLSLIRFFTPASTLVAILAAVRDCLRTRAALQIFKKAMTSASKIDRDPGWHTDRDPLLEKDSRSCWTTRSADGCRVTLKCRIRRRPCSITKRQYNHSERRRRHGEQVQADDGFSVIAKEETQATFCPDRPGAP